MTLTGALSNLGEATRELPSDIPAGTIPALSCYFTIGTPTTVWVNVADGYSDTSLFCRLSLDASTGRWRATMTNLSTRTYTNYFYAFVAVY